jgi:hypothetical protein
LLTDRETVTISVALPDVPVTLILYVPIAADEATAIVMVEVPAPVIDEGLKVTVTPAGRPVADKDMPAKKPFVTVLVRVDVPEPPCTTETVVTEAVRPKPGVLIVLSSPLIRPLPFGLPQPVAKSYPIVAE